MPKPRLPMALQKKKVSKEEREKREKMEMELRGKADKLKPPKNLTKGAKKYFKEIVTSLEESKYLGNGDIGLITITSMTRDKIDQLEMMIQTSSNIEDLKNLMRLQDTLQKSLRGYYNDLGLSPSSRSKLVSLMVDKEQEAQDPLLQALKELNS